MPAPSWTRTKIVLGRPPPHRFVTGPRPIFARVQDGAGDCELRVSWSFRDKNHPQTACKQATMSGTTAPWQSPHKKLCKHLRCYHSHRHLRVDFSGCSSSALFSIISNSNVMKTGKNWLQSVLSLTIPLISPPCWTMRRNSNLYFKQNIVNKARST